MKYKSLGTIQTKEMGEKLAKEILKSGNKNDLAQVIALKGDLGGGKTTFLQGFALGLGIKEKILSPTFVILKKFKIVNSSFKYFYHVDCYRIKDEKEVLELGFEEIISGSQNIIAIEWAERVKKILPKKMILLDFKFLNENNREIILKK